MLFVSRSRRYLSAEYLPKVRACLSHLSDEDLWWRPNEASNSIGNLVLHLAGNLRQWVVSGVGSAPDERERAREFEARGGGSADELLAILTAAVEEADGVLELLSEVDLAQRRTIQGRETTVLEAIYHAVEHFAMHTGQIVYITKERTGADLGFYELTRGIARARWPGRDRDL